jgi:ABC-type lipoprotein release transport system permease subunit/ABC-type Zn uptake system ZnuABC Zn-binding protein ZnuA
LNLAFYIARRYLFAKKSHNAINIISMVSVCGVVVATIAMVCTLSVFNGFEGLTTTLFSVFDPDLKIIPVEGKVFDPTAPEMKKVCELPEIRLSCGVLQENALVRYGERQEISILKGVDSSFHHLVQIDTAIIDGKFILNEGEFSCAVLGIGLASALGVNAAFAYPLEIFMPERMGTINIANPATSAIVEYVCIGGVYHINQPVYDEGFMLLPIDLLRSMLAYEKEVSALELKLIPGADASMVKKNIANLIGNGFIVKDRYEQQESSFKMVQIEKWVTYLMLCFILILALFNVLGSLAILMIEKEEDVSKLRSMGASNRLINRVFLFEGWMISLLGAFIGVVIGIILCFLQQRFGLISLGETAGTFIVDAYPVKVEWTDVLIVFLTVVTVGFIAVLYPVHYLGKKWLNKGSVACLLLSFIMASCGGQKKETKNERSSESKNEEIAVTIEPLRYFAEKIAGGNYTFFSIVPVGRSPETYDPSPREMIRVGRSKAYFHIRQLGLEQVLIKSVQENNTCTQLFDISEGMNFHRSEGCADVTDHDEAKAYLPDERIHDTESNHCEDRPDGIKSHSCNGGHDPHIWTSFAGARIMSENIYKAFASFDSEKSLHYEANYLRLMNELELLENTLHEQLDTLVHRGFVIYHPALTYFAEEFGLIQYSIEENGKEPAPSSLKKLIEEARSTQVKVVFVQMEFDRKHAEQIAAEIGARVVTINPLADKWDEQMKRIAKALVTNGEID